MEWEDREGSQNVEDRRGIGPGMLVGGGGLVTVVIVVVALLTGHDPRQFLQQVGGPSAQAGPAAGAPRADDPQAKFVSVVLKDTEDAWHQLLPPLGRQYENPHLVLFDGAVDSACGLSSAAVGPFYCPQDQRVYLDLSFFRELDQRFGAPGDFARAYVIAHEVGHHVQNLLGIFERVRQQQGSGSDVDAKRLSVRLELQADCFAGVWAHRAQQEPGLLDPGDLEQGLRAAAAIGDDRLQRQAQGYVVPESFTHGTSEQRGRWFRRGLDGGQVSSCDTFAGEV